MCVHTEAGNPDGVLPPRVWNSLGGLNMSIVARACLASAATVVVAKYRRVSTAGQLDGFGLDDQDDVCNGWLGDHPETAVFDDYVDEAVPGSLASRPEMDRLVRDARRGSFDRILVPQVDRIGRSARAAYQWAWDMADLGIHFIAVREDIDTSTEVGWNQFKRFVTYSEMEWRHIKARTVAGRELKISYGGWPGGPAPYGYRIASDAVQVGTSRRKLSVLVTDERESMVLGAAVSLMVDEGLNISDTAAALNRRGLCTRSGVAWTPANLRNRLRSETIHDGYVVYRKTSRGVGKGNTLVHADGTPVHGEQVKIGVPATEERAKLLMSALKKVGFRNGRHEDGIYPLSGRILGRCGEPYVGAGRGGNSAHRAYRCRGLIKAPSCGEPHFNAPEIERVVWNELAALASDGVQLSDATTEPSGRLLGDRAKYEQRVAELRERMAQLDDLIERRVPEYLKAGIDPVVLRASVVKMREELDEARGQRALAEEWLTEYGESARSMRNLADIISGPRQNVDDVSLEERREVFALLDVMVHPGVMESQLKPGVKCPVSEWHWATGTLVPPDPSEEEWEAVVEAVRPFVTTRHFTSKYDIRQQFNGMLHRLREGLSWGDMPLTWGPPNAIRERQLSWWQKGAWPHVMEVLDSGTRGVPVRRRPMLPQVKVIVRNGVRLFTQGRREG